MKKLKLFTLAIAALLTGNALAVETETGNYSVRTLDGAKSTWSFIFNKDAAKDIAVASKSGVAENGLYFYSASSKQKVSKSGYLSSSGQSTIAIEVPSASAAGTITMTLGSSSESRYLQLYVNDVAGTVNQRLWSKAGTDLDKKGPQSYTFTSADISTINGKYYLKFIDNNTEMKIASFEVELTNGSYEIMATDIATLKSITIDGVALENFDPATESYNVELPYGTTTVPTVAAVCTSSKANAVITPAADVNSAATIVVTAEDGTTTKTYTINFSVAATQSSNAFLSDLTVDGKTISGFKKDSFNYNYQVAYNQEAYPVVAATVEDATATPVISQITSYPASATVVVTAQDGTTIKTYTINFTKATYPKVISSIVFSNGAKGAANESEATVKVPYLSTDAAAPTISEITVLADNEYIKADDESTITVSSKTDLTSLVYNVTKVALTPASIATNQEIDFDGTESYIFSTYGFDASKGWKFAKAKEEESNRRISDGRSRIYFALPAAKEVVLTSGNITGRAIKVYVNNVENTDVTATVKSGSITITLNQNAANLLAIESNQTDGDGGFIKIKLVPVDGGNPETSIDAINSNATAVKRIVNGQLVIEKNGVLYNALGNIVK